MIDWLDQVDKTIFLWLNSIYSDFSDKAWLVITYIPTWIPLYVLIFFLFIRIFKKDSIYLIAGLLLVVLVCDQFTSGFMKPFFERPRPCHNAEIAHLVHVANKCGGKFGFASGHSANSFGIAMFVWMVFRSYWKWSWLIFIWAAVVAYSRIAIGVHYPGDILAGGILGISFSYLIFRLTSEIYFRSRQKPLIKN
jgi:undecaprenyl-diphosphatase